MIRSLILWLAVACTPSIDGSPSGTEPGTVAGCVYDDDTADDPVEIALEAPLEGYVCPRGDLDWYRIAMPTGTTLLEVRAAIDSIVSPVEVTWTLFSADGSRVLGGPEPGEAALAGVPLTLVHSAAEPAVLLQVRDLAGDGEDFRHPYTLTVGALVDADGGEPNDEPGSAVPLTGSVTGYVAARGDHDWYTFDATANSAATLRMSSPVADYEPRFSVHAPNGTVVADEANPAATVAVTDLVRRVALDQAGTWSVLVQDDDDLDFDVDAPYQLSLVLGDDPDDNEPNDHPGSATGLVTAACEGDWSPLAEVTGYLATSGDIDWYALDVSDCASGLVYADVQFAEGTLPDGFDAELRLLRSHPDTGCALDQDCASLNERCTTNDDCATIGNSCGLDGFCEGAGVCLPDQRCGANVVIEQSEPGIGGRVGLRAPLFGPGPAWLGVADHRGDAHSPDVSYQITARVRTDPDPHEPNNHYTAGPPASAQAGRHDDYAVEIPVYNCIEPPAPMTGDTAVHEPRVCCTDVSWTEGWLAYDYDQDWFRYAHPCPGEDCMVRLHVEVDEGPVDTLVQVWRRTSLWFDGITGVDDRPGDQHPIAVTYGGLQPTDECFYAFEGHNGNPYWYHVSLRDFAGSGHWESSAGQRYRVCVEKVAHGCLEPCVEHPNGCGTP